MITRSSRKYAKIALKTQEKVSNRPHNSRILLYCPEIMPWDGVWAMENYEELDGADKEVQIIIQILRRITGPNRVFISEPKLDQLCFECKRPMCSVDIVNNGTYFQCFACGHKELEL
jgi:DNA-directed RNA polymerase subunit RPC12/RpoP